LTREAAIDVLRHTRSWEVVVIGGGATGLGAAVDAAQRGYKTLLLESYDFAKGTSSRATKLVHGGVRYLAQGNIALVQHALHERGLMRQNAPHLVRTLGFVIPSYDWWAVPFYGLGMKAYELLAGKLNLASSRTLSKAEVGRKISSINTEGLLGGVLYFDAQFDDSRLAVSLLRTLLDLGGTALNYAPVTGLLKNNNQVCGVCLTDLETSETFELHASAVINATGVFADAVRRMDDSQSENMLSPSQGAHLVVDARFLPGTDALMIPKTDDGRVLFAVPWHDKVILGTTDGAVEEISLEPRPLEAEIEFILRTAARYLAVAPTRADVRSAYAGLRPLVKAGGEGSTKALSRDHAIRISATGLITITGGKWTTYRHMAADVVNRAAEVGRLRWADSSTANLKLHGYSLQQQPEPWQVYGADADEVRALPGADVRLSPLLPLTEAQVRYAARFEMARTVEDVLARRTRAILLDAKASLGAAGRVAEILVEELGHSPQVMATQLETYSAICAGYNL
jgi:glycerol-3-phosphate dehydrogenase